MSSWAIIVLIRYRCSFMLTNCSHFSPFRAATMATHMHGLNFTLKSWAESLALIMHGPYQPLCVILTVCEQPPLSVRSCHVCINLSCLCSGFVSCQTLHPGVAFHRLSYLRTFIFYVLIRPQANIHTMQVPLVRGSLRLAPLSTRFNFMPTSLWFAVQRAKAVHVQKP